MPYMSDTMRVEMSLPAHIMLSVLLSGANCTEPAMGTIAWFEHHQRLIDDPKFAKSYEIFKQTKGFLIQACDEALAGVFPEKKEMSLLRRIERLHHEIVEPYIKTDSPDPRKIGIMAFYLLQHLVETETLIVPEDSSFGKALEHMLPALSPWEGSTEKEIEDYDRLNKSACKQVRKIIQNLQNQGYYKGIPLPDY